jgi:hypothetical protein
MTHSTQIKSKNMQQCIKNCYLIFNVRTLNRGGKFENLKKEMQKNEVSILGVSEVRWKGQGNKKW